MGNERIYVILCISFSRHYTTTVTQSSRDPHCVKVPIKVDSYDDSSRGRVI